MCSTKYLHINISCCDLCNENYEDFYIKSLPMWSLKLLLIIKRSKHSTETETWHQNRLNPVYWNLKNSFLKLVVLLWLQTCLETTSLRDPLQYLPEDTHGTTGSTHSLLSPGRHFTNITLREKRSNMAQYHTAFEKEVANF